MSQADGALPPLAPEFWREKDLSDMNAREWEALCDGCGKCCLNKLEDEETGQIAWTRIACKLLDDQTCRCKSYANRHDYVPECLVLRPKTMAEHAHFLPQTCAYRLLWEGRDLYPWHPLISGDRETVHQAGISLRGETLSEVRVPEDFWEDYVIKEPLG